MKSFYSLVISLPKSLAAAFQTSSPAARYDALCLDVALHMRSELREKLRRIEGSDTESISDRYLTVNKVITADGYTADIVVELNYKLYVFDIRLGMLKSGRLGMEILASALELIEATKNLFEDRNIQIVFVSPSGAPQYVSERLHAISSAAVVAEASSELANIISTVAQQVAFERNQELGRGIIYDLDMEFIQENLDKLTQEQQRVAGVILFGGQTLSEAAQELNLSEEAVRTVWKDILQTWGEDIGL